MANKKILFMLWMCSIAAVSYVPTINTENTTHIRQIQFRIDGQEQPITLSQEMRNHYYSLPNGPIQDPYFVLDLQLNLEPRAIKLETIATNQYTLKYLDYDFSKDDSILSGTPCEKNVVLQIKDASIVFSFPFAIQTKDQVKLELFIDTTNAENPEFYISKQNLTESSIQITGVPDNQCPASKYSNSSIFDLIYEFAKRLEYGPTSVNNRSE